MDPLALRVAERFGATHTWKIDRAAITRKLKQWNNIEARKASMTSQGGYEDFKLVIVPISKINVPPMWKEAGPVRDKMREGTPIDPVRLSLDSEKYAIKDGIHRTNVAKEMGFTHVPAIVATWIETPEAKAPVPEKPQLQVGDWIKLHKPENGRVYGWVDAPMDPREDRGVKRWEYGVALVREGDTWPDFVDLKDTEFEPTSPPLWGPSVRARMDTR